MRSSRREFDKDTKAAMYERAKDASGQIRCEGCGLALKDKDIEYDHVIAEALRPEADKKRKLTPADGQVLGRDCCHRGEGSKTSDDVKRIAKAKRAEKKHKGITAPKQSIPAKPFPVSEKAAKREAKPVAGMPEIFRRTGR